MSMKKNQFGLIGFFLFVLVLVSACSAGTDTTSDSNTVDVEQSNTQQNTGADFETSSVDWKTYALSDITGSEFMITEFDKPIFVETFAVWCSNCKKQQQEITLLHDELGDDVKTIAIEIDPNANAESVAEYVAENGFQSTYVVAPQEFTQSLVDEFGAQVVSAPSVPMLFICGEEVTFLRRGIKPASELKELVEGCNV